MIKTVFRWFSLAIMAWAFSAVLGFGAPLPEQDTNQRRFTVHLQGVFAAKVSLMPLEGLKAVYSKPVGEVSDVKNGETATIEIPARYLPGEFVLRIDYRAKEADHPYPAEKHIFVNKQDVELFVDPLRIHNSDYTKFSAGERENTVYNDFIRENSKKRMPIDLLRQFLLGYDRPKSKLYKQTDKEFQRRRVEYNTWLDNQADAHSELYVSNLFQFQHIPAIEWSGSESEPISRILKNYFEGIDFSDPIIVGSRELSLLMDGYMKLYGMQVTAEEQRNPLFVRAGRIACEIASQGHPKVYGWMVDYFYTGYETYNIEAGMTMLREHINNPNCLTSVKRGQLPFR